MKALAQIAAVADAARDELERQVRLEGQHSGLASGANGIGGTVTAASAVPMNTWTLMGGGAMVTESGGGVQVKSTGVYLVYGGLHVPTTQASTTYYLGVRVDSTYLWYASAAHQAGVESRSLISVPLWLTLGTVVRLAIFPLSPLAWIYARFGAAW